MLLPVGGLLLVNVLFAAADNKCSLGRGGTLTLFDGTKLEKIVRTDCKYRMVDAVCGEYRVMMTPGSNVELETGDFTPDTLRVMVTRLKDGAFRTIRTSNHLIKTNKPDQVWQYVGGDLPLDYMYEREWKAAMTEKRGVFRVIFKNLDDNKDDAGVTFTCFSNNTFVVSEKPTLCDQEFSAGGTSVLAHNILADSRVFQNLECLGSSMLFQLSNVTSGWRWIAITNCNPLFVRAPVAKCLAEKDKLVGDDLENCLRYILLGDSAACGALKEAFGNTSNNSSCPSVDTTESFPFLQNSDCGATPVSL